MISDQFIERLLSEKEDKPKNKKRIIVKDIRIFMNTISHALLKKLFISRLLMTCLMRQ